jgi:DNA modification methylase
MIHLGDGIVELAGLRPGSVDLVLSDLPSGETQAAFDRKPYLPSLWNEVWRALKLDGVAVFMASNIRFAAELVSEANFKYDLIWHKSIAGGFLNAKSRPLRAHEFILVFSREAGAYNPQMRQGLEPVHANAGRGSSGENYGPSGAGASRAGATDRHPWSVLQFASVGTTSPSRKHPQQKPEEMLRWLVRTYSRPGDLVVDPFAGSGSAEVAALAEGREFLGWDSDPRFGGVLGQPGSAGGGGALPQ